MIHRIAKKGSDKVTVTFSLAEAVLRGHGVDSQRVAVVGDFNDWDPTVAPWSQSGRRTATLLLPPGRHHAFRHLSERGRWMNDEDADAYEPNEFGVDNSILDLRRDHVARTAR